MEQTEMLYLNFDGVHSAEVYGIPDDIIERISHTLAKSAHEIVSHHKDYTWRKGEDSGLHKGKILKRLLRDIPDFQERIVVISLTDGLIKQMLELLVIKNALNDL